LPLPLRFEVQHIISSEHGGIDYAELEALGIASEEVLDFSANLNPFGPPPGIEEVMSQADIAGYPDSRATNLRRLLADKLRVKVKNILIGSGSTELIRLVALAYFGRGDSVLIIEPTFGEYQVACQISGASLIKQRRGTENGFRLNIEETIELIHRHHPKGIFVDNPNNPTGQYLSQVEFEQLLDAGKDSLLVLDEAYIAFMDNVWPSLDMVEGNNLLILRSMTKDYALAGLRLGYAVAGEEIIATLSRICPPWNVNTVAQKVGIKVLENEGYLKQCQVELKQARGYLVTELKRLGLSPLPSATNFFLVEVAGAAQFRHQLLRKGILVRDCTSFGLPSYVRISPRTLSECRRLVTTVEEITTSEQDTS
jgi:histidinol-phosphate aminotransferase